MVIKGTTSTSFQSVAFETPVKIISFSLVNTTGGAVNATAGAIQGSTLGDFCSKPLAANESFLYEGQPIIVEKGYSIYVTASTASIKYYFSIE